MKRCLHGLVFVRSLVKIGCIWAKKSHRHTSLRSICIIFAVKSKLQSFINTDDEKV